MAPASLNCCLFAIRLPDDQQRRAAERRIEQLERFYAPLGRPATSTRYDADTGLLAGIIRFDGERVDSWNTLAFGCRLPSSLAQGDRLLRATDASLRSLDGPLAAIALGDGEARLISGTGPTSLFAASSSSLQAWSTHGVAAAWLATGGAEVDGAVLPIFLAAEYVGDDRSLILGARAVPAATSIRITRGEVESRSYWPLVERWSPIPETDAHLVAEAELVQALDRQLRDESGTFCALTGGLDSRVVALALGQVGVAFEAFTWGHGDWPDVEAAAEVAKSLGVRHRVEETRWLDGESAVPRVLADVRWTEGGRVEFAQPVVPSELRTLITGGGGETGRSFYYRWAAPLYKEPSASRMTRLVADSLGSRLRGAEPEAVDAFRSAVRRWTDEAEALGARGWRCLDVLYSEQRLRRWGRHMLIRSSAPMVPAFESPGVQRALASAPLTDRLSDGFHRRFIATRRPDLLPPPPPPLVRRRAPRFARRMKRGLRALSARPPPRVPSMWEWEQAPTLRAWVTDEVLTSPLLKGSLGQRWTATTRRQFLEGDGDAQQTALWAAGPVALAAALRELTTEGP